MIQDFLFKKLLTKPFLITVFRYLLVVAGTWLTANGWADQGTIETISGALLVIAVSLMGGTDSVKDKATIDGKTVAAENLPKTLQTDLANAVEVKKSRTIFDILFGK